MNYWNRSSCVPIVSKFSCFEEISSKSEDFNIDFKKITFRSSLSNYSNAMWEFGILDNIPYRVNYEGYEEEMSWSCIRWALHTTSLITGESYQWIFRWVTRTQTLRFQCRMPAILSLCILSISIQTHLCWKLTYTSLKWNPEIGAKFTVDGEVNRIDKENFINFTFMDEF